MNELSLGEHEFIALCDALKKSGVCETGGHAKMVISEGEVKVDGVVELRKRCKIRENQTIEAFDQKVKVVK